MVEATAGAAPLLPLERLCTCLLLECTGGSMTIIAKSAEAQAMPDKALNFFLLVIYLFSLTGDIVQRAIFFNVLLF